MGIKDIPSDRPATFKQSRAVAFKFAQSLLGDYPDINEYALFKLIHGTIYYYHQYAESPLTHGEVQDYLSNDKKIPEYYIEWLDEYIKINYKSKTKKKKSNKNKSNKKSKFEIMTKPQTWEWELNE